MTVTYIVLALTFFVSASETAGPEWGYTDPSKWGQSFASCAGNLQSPIHIVSADAKYEASLSKFIFSGYNTKMPHPIMNNGHSIQLSISYKATVEHGGLPDIYQAFQFHFHWSANKLTQGSEHILNTRAFPLELHIVHMNSAYHNVTEALKKGDGLAVLGFFFEVGKANPALDKILSALTDTQGYIGDSAPFSLAELIGPLDDLEEFYRYQGSLTTPPCSEAVVWTVFNRFLTISKQQLEAFWNVKDSHATKMSNYRPIQDRNNRDIFTSMKKSSGMMTTAISVLVFFSVLLSANLW